MRRLTLILSDLFLPEEADRGTLESALQLPSLDWLLRHARSRQRIGDWRQWLADELGAGTIASLPPARLPSLASGAPEPGSWFATPVHLEARLDHVRMTSRGLLSLPVEQAHLLCEEFLATFGPELTLESLGARDLLLSGGPEAQLHTVDPARLLDADIGAALPAGEAAPVLRRLGAEIEMWLPGTRVNGVREKAGQRRISALWLWGGGPGAAPALSSPPPENPVRLFGGDAWLQAFAAVWAGGPLPAAPPTFAAASIDGPTCIEISPMSTPAPASLADLESRWFAPARRALSQRALEQLCLVANDRVHVIAARGGWRFWRRRRSWLENLGA